jgi:retron-type reverse transcriptase
MGILASRIQDRLVLKLIRKYLQAGIMINGVVYEAEEGTPQGGLCKASHKPPYAKKVIMQSNP